jgi:UDP-GlcNAc:undecaprenyl-phosphate GlcNAc-1-phosphate transferase
MELFWDIEVGWFGFACLGFGGSVVAGTVAYLLRGPASRARLVSRHRRDRFGAVRTPLTGGSGLVAGCLACMLVLGAGPPAGGGLALLGFFLVGLLDDALELRPLVKLLLQMAVALPAAFLLAGSVAHVGLHALLLLLLVNACNYLDNMDGLLAGVALTQALALMHFSTVAGPGATLLVWTLPGILVLAAPPARVYLGDSGSHLVGALLGVEAVLLLEGPTGLESRFLLPLALCFAIPLLDVATVTASRLRRRRPLFRGGTDHLSHRLVRRGVPVPRAVLLLVLASAVCGVSSLLLVHSS